MSNFAKWLIGVPLSITAFLTVVGFVTYLVVSDWVVDFDNRKAAALCAQDAQEGCPLLWEDYVNTKRENERLKLRVRECDVLIPKED